MKIFAYLIGTEFTKILNSNNWYFKCDLGWSDSRSCSKDINECNNQPPVCFNNATCTNNPGSFICECPPTFTGPLCLDRIDYCTAVTNHPCSPTRSISCQNNYKALTFNCTCSPGYTGLTCDIDIDECASQPCLHGGQCVDLVNSFMCIGCVEVGFTGAHYCATLPCIKKQVTSEF